MLADYNRFNRSFCKTNNEKKVGNPGKGEAGGRGAFKWASENNSLFLKPLHLLIVDRFSSNVGEVLKWKPGFIWKGGGILGDFAASNLQLKRRVLEAWRKEWLFCTTNYFCNYRVGRAVYEKRLKRLRNKPINSKLLSECMFWK